MKILIIGASSYVGARLYVDLNKKYDVIGTYHGNKLFKELGKLNITNKIEVNNIISKYKPDIIIQIAANARSKWCEDNPNLAIALNQEATQNIVNAANSNKSKLYFISSFAAINPNNLYGETKYKSEQYVKKVKKEYIIL